MHGLSTAQLRVIDQELKEAVCDAIVNLTSAKVSGAGPEGEILYGASPRRSIVSGQLLPRFDESQSVDETTDIRLATIGVDFQLAAPAAGRVTVAPSFAVYVRVMPSWAELTDDSLDLDLDFKLQGPVQQFIDQRIRDLRNQRLAAESLSQINWRELSRDQQAAMRVRLSAIQSDVRIAAYGERNIVLLAEDTRLGANDADDVPQDQTQPVDVGADDDDAAAQQLRLGRLLRNNRAIPLNLLQPAPVPPKWRRLTLALPPLEWDAAASSDALTSTLLQYNDAMRTAAVQQITAWFATPEAQAEAWRPLTVQPAEGVSQAGWNAYLMRARQTAVPVARLLPKLDDVAVTIDCLPDFADPARQSIRIALDNGNGKLSPNDAKTRSDCVFQTQLMIRAPHAQHRALQLDRVEPSYRYRDFLQYGAMGLNCGVTTRVDGDDIVLTTTWAPRYVQPRIVPRAITMPSVDGAPAPRFPLSFRELSDEGLALDVLLELPAQYQRWITAEETRLRHVVRHGLESDDADRESQRLASDLAAQRAEAAYIERGVRLLMESQAADTELRGRVDDARREMLDQRAAPYRAFVLTNRSFLLREGNDPERGWRLFQLAFILAHIPTFASRIDAYRDYQDAMLDEQAASLLYFPTGGGKSEAFYGALLFAMFFDRLRGKVRGVTGMIRYPLRLLTLQQGQRLLRLIAHAEIVRRRAGIAGWPFEIGFWVGSANTPNRYSGVPASIVPRLGDPEHSTDDQLAEGFDYAGEEEEDTAQKYRDWCAAYNKVPECPVCTRPTGLRRCESETSAKRLAIVCFDPGCAWNQAHEAVSPLPFLLTDDTIYERTPAVVLGTVDKMALLGQNTNTIRQLLGMFGLARQIGPTGHVYAPPSDTAFLTEMASNGRQGVFPAFHDGERVFVDPFPSLVIQDEAHLMEESLGTFSGLFDTLFENALRSIDTLAGADLSVARVWDGRAYGAPRMPKVIAATATISNPERQLNVLYQRAALRFPCPGSDIYRSFFAEPAPAPALNAERVRLAGTLSDFEAPERTSPWMRLYVSLMTNDATHTVTAVSILSAFHTVITSLWRALDDPAQRQSAAQVLRSAVSAGVDGDWRRSALDRATAAGQWESLLALVDLHRIALTYVTNKKGGDQVMDALETTVRQRHERMHMPISGFDSRLISGGVDMREIQSIMRMAEATYEGQDYPPLDQMMRSIVATSAISHGVDVDRFNSMFFAGLPTDIAEYIQASSRVGRTHVGFVMLIPTPQSRRDRYVVETHDIFHRFLERMIAPPAVERWAENAIRRVMASMVQTWVVLQEAVRFAAAADDQKSRVEALDIVRPLGALARHNPIAFADEILGFVLRSVGYEGRGVEHRGRPVDQELYRSMVDHDVADFANSMRNLQTPMLLREYWDDAAATFRPPMTSLRDVDEAGLIVGAAYDAAARGGSRTLDLEELTLVMRAIRSQRGAVAETDMDDRGERA
jgi:hypothetical protein